MWLVKMVDGTLKECNSSYEVVRLFGKVRQKDIVSINGFTVKEFKYKVKNKLICEDVEELRQRSLNSGSYFFSKDTMRFFASRVGSVIYGGRYFITSEKSCFNDDTRVFTIRQYNIKLVKRKTDKRLIEEVRIETIERGLISKETAKRHVKKLIKELVEVEV